VDLAGLEKEGEAAPETASMAAREAFLYVRITNKF
jgi:hypothetical protein